MKPGTHPREFRPDFDPKGPNPSLSAVTTTDVADALATLLATGATLTEAAQTLAEAANLPCAAATIALQVARDPFGTVRALAHLTALAGRGSRDGAAIRAALDRAGIHPLSVALALPPCHTSEGWITRARGLAKILNADPTPCSWVDHDATFFPKTAQWPAGFNLVPLSVVLTDDFKGDLPSGLTIDGTLRVERQGHFSLPTELAVAGGLDLYSAPGWDGEPPTGLDPGTRIATALFPFNWTMERGRRIWRGGLTTRGWRVFRDHEAAELAKGKPPEAIRREAAATRNAWEAL
jgi:hypothetical protein